jgi:ankyrin repeat protein
MAAEARLADALQNKDAGTARSLLQQHVDVNAAQGDGATPLAWAAHWDDVETADLLIKAGANVNAANEYGFTPLLLACINGSAAMTEKLLKAHAAVNTPNLTGETPLMLASHTGNVDVVKSLLIHGADVNAKEKEKGQTALMWAAAEKHPVIVAMLLEYGADIHARSKGGFTPLLFASRQGDLESARILVGAGVSVNEATTDGMTALLVASAAGHEELAEFLLDKGADPNAADGFGVTALHYAVRKGFPIPGVDFGSEPLPYYQLRPNLVGLVKALLAKGANPNARITKARPPALPSRGVNVVGATPFLLAAADNDVIIMKALVEGGADPKIPTKQGNTPLMAAAGLGRPKYPLEESEQKGVLEASELAAELSPDVNVVNEAGQSALHAAAYVGAAPVVQFLADKGAKLDAKDKVIGATPLMVSEGVIPTGGYAVVAAYALSTKEGLTIAKPMGARRDAADLIRKLTGAGDAKLVCPAYLPDSYNNLLPAEWIQIHCPAGR